MERKAYHKLVRDRIPEIIQNAGKTCSIEVLSDEEYIRLLDEKLTEEINEYRMADNAPDRLEELADVLEVLRAAVTARGFSWEQLEQMCREKAESNGAFEKKLLLTEVLDAREDGISK